MAEEVQHRYTSAELNLCSLPGMAAAQIGELCCAENISGTAHYAGHLH